MAGRPPRTEVTTRPFPAMLAIVRSQLHPVWLVVCVLLVGSFARADRPAARKQASVVARVVGLEIYNDDTAIVTIAAGSEQGIGKGWHARFREGQTAKLLAGGEATIIRIDRRSSILRTELTPAQVRAHRFIQLDP
jgi:hypothetical protein